MPGSGHEITCEFRLLHTRRLFPEGSRTIQKGLLSTGCWFRLTACAFNGSLKHLQPLSLSFANLPSPDQCPLEQTRIGTGLGLRGASRGDVSSPPVLLQWAAGWRCLCHR